MTTVTKPPTPLESAIQASIVTYLRLKNYYVLRLNSGAVRDATGRPVRMAAAGTPDLLALKDGHPPLFVEVKRPGSRPSATQDAMMAELRAHGATTLVATSVADLQNEKI